MKELSKSWRDLVRLAQEAAQSGVWEPIAGNKLRYSETDLPTPANLPERWWPWPTYNRHVFLTFVPGRSVILGVASSPWTGRQDSEITQKRAREVLADPAALFAKRPITA